jgi:hypothetical protein
LARAKRGTPRPEFFGSRANSFERVDLSPQDFGKLIQGDLKHWSDLIRSIGVKID